MRTLFYLLLACAFFISPILAHAETHVYSDDLSHGGTWTKIGSPYILEEQVYVPDGYSLNVSKGVTVMLASTTSAFDSMVFDGDFSVWGSTEEPVVFDKLGQIFLSRNTADIRNATFDSTNLDFKLSTSTLNNVTIKNSDFGISVRGSTLAITKSKILNNRIGIGSYQYFKGPFLMKTPLQDLDQEQNIISITDSTIKENTEYEIENQTINPIEADDNWWGNANGPNKNKIYGQVNTTPWKDKDPDESICCSSVLFLPGIEASRLYTTGNQLWEPNRNDDIRKMYLDNTGKSIDSSIYTSDILSSAFGLKNIYKSFVAMMNGVVADNVINEWLPFPYDWRMNVEDVVYGQTRLASTSISLIMQAESLAKNSKTHKIIIVAHSNGGLVTKTLMKALEEKGESEIIEKIIYVAVPELGTPQALLSMLHGHSQSIALGLITTEDNARTFSQNMSSAYGLLPSKKFFEKNSMKVISDLFSGTIEKTASSYDSMKNFLFLNSFSKASTTDTDIPLLLNSSLMKLAEQTHSKIDSWFPASTTKTLSIFGWGLPTSAGIKYEKDRHCIFKKCTVAYSPIATTSGDGTVLTDSSTGLANKNLFIDLKSLVQNAGIKINHANILESNEILETIKNEISSSTPGQLPHITETRPVDTGKWLTIKLFSPVDMEIFDKNGNTDIPASYYEDFGKIKMAMLPYDPNYQIVLKGTDTGVFTIDTEISQQGKVISSNSFEDVPVTPSLNAELVLATSTSLYIDTNGDGTTEYVLNNKKMRKDYKKKIRRILKGKFDRKARFW
jgi:hypothetical protein